jgi:two-component system response regulator GlrR
VERPLREMMDSVRVHIITDDDNLPVALALREVLRGLGWIAVELAVVDVGNLSASHLPPDLIFVFVCADSLNLERGVKILRFSLPDAVFLFVNMFDVSSSVSGLLSAGFDDFIRYPFSPDTVGSTIKANLTRNHVSRRREADGAKTRLKIEIGLSDLIGSGPSFTRVLQEIITLARTDATALIFGETGTGKDLCARAIHYASARARMPFLPVNCGGIPDDLFENEFFGHERGAYTDARDRYPGLIHEAERGTIFLDDIESLSMKNQAKLLRFLEGTEYMPLGSSKIRTSNVRIIAATNADLVQRVKQNLFREDLYFRLAVLTITIPPLRSRAEDIPALALHFLTHYSAMYGKQGVRFAPRALERLSAHSWPGNVRELENVVHNAVIHCDLPVISDIPVGPVSPSTALPELLGANGSSFSLAKKELVSRFEREYVQNLLRDCGGNISEAARRAGKHRRAFWELMRKYRIPRNP